MATATPAEQAPMQAARPTLTSASRQGSTLVLARWAESTAQNANSRSDSRLVLVADEDDRAVLVLDPDTGAIRGRRKLNGRPGQVVVLESNLVAVALRDESKVAVFSVESESPQQDGSFRLKEEFALYTASEPIALAVSPEAAGPRQLYVATGHGRTLERFDIASRKKKVIFDIAEEPRAVVAADDGTVIVSHANAGVLTTVRDTKVTVDRLDEGESFSRQGFALTSIGNDVFAPDTFVMPEDASGSMRGVAAGYGGGTVCEQDGWHKGWVVDQPVAKHAPTVQSKHDARGASTTAASGFAQFNPRTIAPAIRHFDCVQVMSTAGTLRRVGSRPDGARVAVVTQLGTKCILPRAAAAHAGKREVYVACLGTNRIEAIDIGADSEAGTPLAPPRMSRGWSVPKGPVGLAVDGDTLFAWSQFDHRLAKVDLNASSVASFDVRRDVEISRPFALGRELFHAAGDPRISQDGRTCASCHPDGLSDGIGWATPEGRRKPMILAGRIGEGPFGWRGEHKTLREHIGKTIITNLHGTGLATDAMESLEAYVRALPTPRGNKANSDETKHGQELFARGDTGCVRCHDPQKNFTDGAVHDVGTGGKFRTPPLTLASVAAPYAHEAKYTKLDDFLRATDGKMGHTSQLTDEEFRDLVRYVRSL
ncbi:MAG: c-type cytochrome [Polyangiaceae bacterium]